MTFDAIEKAGAMEPESGLQVLSKAVEGQDQIISTPKPKRAKTTPQKPQSSPYSGWDEWDLTKFEQMFPDPEADDPKFTGPMMKREHVLRGYAASKGTHRRVLIAYTQACRRGDTDPQGAQKRLSKQRSSSAAAAGRTLNSSWQDPS